MSGVVGVPYRSVDPSPAGPRLVTRVVTPENNGIGKVVVRVDCVGVCDSDIKELQGRRPVRRDFGHEVFGRVVWAAPASVIAAGTPVVLDPHIPLVARSTGYAEYLELEGDQEQLRRALVTVPDSLSRTAGVFVEPLSCALHCVTRLTEVSRPLGLAAAEVTVYGAGLAGTLIAALLTRQGATVRLTNRSSSRLQFLRSTGVLGDSVTAEREFLAGKHRRIVVATSVLTPVLWRKVTSTLADDGLLLIFAGTAPGLRLTGLDVDRVRRRELIAEMDSGRYVAGSYGATAADFAGALRCLADADGRLLATVNRLVVEWVPLDRAASTLASLVRRDRPGKVVVDARQ